MNRRLYQRLPLAAASATSVYWAVGTATGNVGARRGILLADPNLWPWLFTATAALLAVDWAMGAGTIWHRIAGATLVAVFGARSIALADHFGWTDPAWTLWFLIALLVTWGWSPTARDHGRH